MFQVLREAGLSPLARRNVYSLSVRLMYIRIVSFEGPSFPPEHAATGSTFSASKYRRSAPTLDG